MDIKGGITTFVTPHNLYIISAWFGILTLVSVLAIYYVLWRKKDHNRNLVAVREMLDEWISEALIEDSDFFTHKYIIIELIDHFKEEEYRQFTIDKLINSVLSLKGDAVNNIVHIYIQLNLQDDSAAKFGSIRWEKKARGIYELYMMRQTAFKEEIRAEINNSNEFVRTEAQIALITFDGFDGLTFLSDLKWPLTQWQQLKILDRLQTFEFRPMDRINDWITSDNRSVALFAIRLAEIYQQYQCVMLIQQHLHSQDGMVRLQAVKTLGHLAQYESAEQLKPLYASSDTVQQREILKALGNIGREEDIPFLTETIPGAEPAVRLEAVRAVFACSGNRREVLFQKLADTGLVSGTIVKQVIQEHTL